MTIVVVAGLAVAASFSQLPIRWFIRFPLLIAGMLIGTGALVFPRGESRAAESWPRASGLLLLWSAIACLGLRYLIRSALPYYRFDPVQFEYLWDRRFWVIAHITGGMTAVLLGPWQFLARLRTAAPAWHFWMGRLYVGGVTLAALCSLPLALHLPAAEGGRISGVSMAVLALVWLTTTGLGLREILRRRVTAHRAWMIRSYAVTLAFVNIRWLIELPWLTRLAPLPQLVPIVIWVSWVLPLCAVEIALRRASRRMPPF